MARIYSLGAALFLLVCLAWSMPVRAAGEVVPTTTLHCVVGYGQAVQATRYSCTEAAQAIVYSFAYQPVTMTGCTFDIPVNTTTQGTCSFRNSLGSTYTRVSKGVSVAASCPTGATMQPNGTCTCDLGYLLSGTSCTVATPQLSCAELVKQYNANKYIISFSASGSTPSICVNGCTLNTGSAVCSGSGGSITKCSYFPPYSLASSATSCPAGTPPVLGYSKETAETSPSASPSVGTASQSYTVTATKCTYPYVTGEVAIGGVTTTVCVLGQSTSSTTTSTGTDASGSSTGTTTSVTTCSAYECTTTKTTTSATGAVTGTQTETKKQDSFCADNPSLSICKKSSFGGSCASSFQCDGDAIQCAVARKQHETACKIFDDPDAQASKSIFDAEKVTSKAAITAQGRDDAPVNIQSSITPTNLLGAAPACLANKTFVVMGRTISIDLSVLCQWLGYFGQLNLALSFLAAAMIVFKG